MDSSSVFHSPHSTYHHGSSSYNSNSPPELSTSSPDSSSSDGTGGEDYTNHLQDISSRRGTVCLNKLSESSPAFIDNRSSKDRIDQPYSPFSMTQLPSSIQNGHGSHPNDIAESGAGHSLSTSTNGRASKSSGSSILSELTSSDESVSLLGMDSSNESALNGNGNGGGNGMVALGNGLFSYTKNTSSDRNVNGLGTSQNGSGQDTGCSTDWKSNVDLQNGYVSDSHHVVMNGRNPPTTIPRLHSALDANSSPRPVNGINDSDAMQLDASNGNSMGTNPFMRSGDADEDMFESLIQEDSFDPPSLGNSVSPEQPSRLLPQSGLSISTASDRIPPSYYPSQFNQVAHQMSGQISAGAEGETGSPPLSADPSVLSSRRNSSSGRNGDHFMGNGIVSASTPSVAGTSSYASGDDAPTPASATTCERGRRQASVASQSQRSSTLSSKTPKSPSISTITGLTPEGEIPFSSKKTNLVAPSIPELNQGGTGTGKLQVHVHGLPRKGAKSRVETQVKMRLELVRERSSPSGTSPSDEKEWERIGSFTHLKLPPLSGSKRSQKKYQFNNVDPERTLFVDIVVVKASPPHDKVIICEACSNREARKAQRSSGGRKSASKKGGNDDDLSTDDDDFKFFGIDRNLSNSRELLREKKAEAELSRSVVFNCGDYLEFEDGHVILPTRITCYCRHHSEKLGFCIIFTMRDWQSNVVATGSTPPIMITDDHKATSKALKEKAEEASAAAVANANANANASAKTSAKTKSATSRATVSSLPKSGRSSERGVGRTTYNSSVSRRNSLSKDASPSVTQSETTATSPSESSALLGASTSGASKKKERAKPYDKASSSKSRQRSESGNTSLIPSKTPRSGNVTENATSATSSSPPPHQQPMQFSPSSSIEANEDWTSFAAAAGLMSRSASDSGRSMTTANAFSPMSSSGLNADSQPPNAASTEIRSRVPSHMQGSLSPSNLQTNLQSTPAFDLERFLRDAQDGVPVNSSGLQEFIALNGGRNGNDMDIDVVNLQQQQTQFSHSQSQPDSLHHQPSPLNSSLQQSLQPHSVSNQSPPSAPIDLSVPVPRVEKLIPGEGPTSGGIEVTILGSGFLPGLRCVFGDVQAPETKVWASNTLVCILPPSQSPGPVVVSLKRVMQSGELRDLDYRIRGTNDHNNHPLRFFTYVDKTDRALMELALQVVGLQMTGQMQSARDVAMRVVGSGGAGSNGPSPSHSRGGSSSTPSGQSRPTLSAGADEVSSLFAAGRGSNQSFQTSVLAFLSLLDVDLTNQPNLPDGAPRLDALSLANAQGHTLLHLAVILGLHKLVEALLARKNAVPVNARDNNGYTALHFAALHGRLTIARTLLSRKARDDLVNVEGKIPLEVAREKEQVDVEMLLMENSSELARARLLVDSPRLLEPESMSDESQGLDTNSNKASSDDIEDIDEDNISTCASHAETSSDEGCSQESEGEEEEHEQEILSSQIDSGVLPSPSINDKGSRTPQPLDTPQDEKRDLFSLKLDEKENHEVDKLRKDKAKEKEVESANISPGNDHNLAFKDWLIQASDSVRAGHGLEWAASNLPSGRRALQLIPRPNMALSMHMPAVPVFHLTLPTTPRFGTLSWNSNSSSAATTPSTTSSKGKDKELSQADPSGSKSETNTEPSSTHATGVSEPWASDEARKVINMCKSIVEESALWLNPLYQPLDSTPPPTYESALASTSGEETPQEPASEGKDKKETQIGCSKAGQVSSRQPRDHEVSQTSSAFSSSQRRPSATSRATWNGRSHESMNQVQDIGIVESSGKIPRPSSALSGPSNSSDLLISSSSSQEPPPSALAISNAASTRSAVSLNSNRRRTRTHTQPRRGLRDDLMLIFFWFPALIVVILLLLFSKNSSIFSLDELLSFIPGPIADATKAVRSASFSNGNAAKTPSR